MSKNPQEKLPLFASSSMDPQQPLLDVGLTTKKQETPRDETRGIRWLRIFTTADYLKLYENPWKIKKTLETSDCNHLCRLMLSTKTVEKNILAFWDVETVKNVATPEGVRVKVWDYDSGTEHLLTFKKWASSGCFVFVNNWRGDFVRRRKLQQGDEIGLFWDASEKRFGFRVLDHLSPAAAPLSHHNRSSGNL